MKFAVLVFPGSNCDIDCYKAVQETLGEPVDFVWHTATDLSDYDCILVPGGFSYGDYLRCGAISQFAPVMNEVAKAAEQGKFVLGICNGFQILTEAGLLPGALRRNESMKFRCHDTTLKVVNNTTPFTTGMPEMRRSSFRSPTAKATITATMRRWLRLKRTTRSSSLIRTILTALSPILQASAMNAATSSA